MDVLFGFFYCKIEAPTNNYLGLLPVKILQVDWFVP